MRLFLASGLSFVLVAALVSPSWAQDAASSGSSPSPPSLQQARAAYVMGMDLLEKEEWQAAADRFLYAAEGRRTAGLLYHAAFCLEKLERYSQALALYQESQALADQEKASDVQALLPEALKRTDEALPQLTLHHLPADGVVEVNGQVHAAIPVLRLDPGRYSVVVLAPGHQAYEAEVHLTAAARVDLDVTLRPHPVQKTKPPQERKTEPARERTPKAKPYVVAAAAVLGASGLGVGIYGTVEHARLGKRQEELGNFIDEESARSSSSCVDPGASWADACAELRDVTHDRKMAKTLMIVGYTTSGVGAIAALGTQIFWRSPGVEVAWLPGGGFVSVTRQF